jgi:hypothetical protein
MEIVLIPILLISSLLFGLWSFHNVLYYSTDIDQLNDIPPYLYLTTNSRFRNILKYSRSGRLLSTEVLQGGPVSDEAHFVKLRAMVHGTYKGEKVLYVADANTLLSYVMIYGECNTTNEKRSFIKTAFTSDENKGARHPYGISFDRSGHIYTSFQGTDLVLRFAKDTFQPLPLPPTLMTDYKWNEYYAGSFVQFGKIGMHNEKEQGIRGIVVVRDTLWVANKDIGGIAVVILETGLIQDIIVVEEPIALYYDEKIDLVFAGSKVKQWGGKVYAIDPYTLRFRHTYTNGKISHPAGIVSYGDELFVAEQSMGQVLKFDIHSERFLGTIVTDGPALFEHLILSDC